MWADVDDHIDTLLFGNKRIWSREANSELIVEYADGVRSSRGGNFPFCGEGVSCALFEGDRDGLARIEMHIFDSSQAEGYLILIGWER